MLVAPDDRASLGVVGVSPSGRPASEDALVSAARNLRALIMAGERYRHSIAGSGGLGISDSQAVGYLFVHGARGQTELSKDLGLTSSAATSLVDRLERRGVAERTRHPTDRRRMLVRLTSHGERVAQDDQQPLLEALGLVLESDLAVVAGWLGVLADDLLARSLRPAFEP